MNIDYEIDSICFKEQEDKCWSLDIHDNPNKNYQWVDEPSALSNQNRLRVYFRASVKPCKSSSDDCEEIVHSHPIRIGPDYTALKIFGYLTPNNRDVSRLQRLLCEPRRWESVEFKDSSKSFLGRSTIYITILCLVMRSTEEVTLRLGVLDEGLFRCIHSAISHHGNRAPVTLIFAYNDEVAPEKVVYQQNSGPLLALALANNKSIRKLKFQLSNTFDNDIVPAILPYIFNGLKRNSSVVRDLSVNSNFDSSGVLEMTEYLACKKCNLVKLQLIGIDIGSFLSSIQNVRLNTLEFLDLSCTGGGGTCQDEKLLSLSKSCPRLIELNICLCQINDFSGLDYYLLDRQSLLTKIDLSFNDISGENFHVFCTKIPLIKKIRHLKFSYNPFLYPWTSQQVWKDSVETYIGKNESIESMLLYNGEFPVLPLLASRMNYNRINRMTRNVNIHLWPAILERIMTLNLKDGNSSQEELRFDVLYQVVKKHVLNVANS